MGSGDWGYAGGLVIPFKPQDARLEWGTESVLENEISCFCYAWVR
jgi:hypothetical protein